MRRQRCKNYGICIYILAYREKYCIWYVSLEYPDILYEAVY